MLAALNLDPAHECERIVAFIQTEFQHAGLTNGVLGLSGGIDSAVVGALAVRALGAANVYTLLMPYCTSNPESEAHGQLMAEQLGTPCERLEITPFVDPLFTSDPAMNDRRKGNIMARARMVALYDRSGKVNGLVLGTSNRTETLLGYFTMHGDGAAALKPIAHLYKCQVRQLARYLGVPEPIIVKAPSADLWAGQTDEGDLGYTYDEADQILYLLTEEHLGEGQIASLGFDPRVVKAVNARMHGMAFKLRRAATLPPGH